MQAVVFVLAAIGIIYVLKSFMGEGAGLAHVAGIVIFFFTIYFFSTSKKK